MGPGQNFFTGVRSVQFFVARVGSAIYGLGLNFENFPLKMSNFSIFFSSGQKKSLLVGSESTRVKAGSASYLLRVKSKFGLGQGPSLPQIQGATCSSHPAGYCFVRSSGTSRVIWPSTHS